MIERFGLAENLIIAVNPYLVAASFEEALGIAEKLSQSSKSDAIAVSASGRYLRFSFSKPKLFHKRKLSPR